MKQQVTSGIILTRTDYGEADRILSLLTPDHGKLRLLAKGVRREKSKLAGGIELFSVSSITFIQGRGDIGTLVSTRLITHYGRIVEDLDRTMLGYQLIKQLNKTTEDHPDTEYFNLLHQTFQALNDFLIAPAHTELWFLAQLLKIGGHTPNLTTDKQGNALDATRVYSFDVNAMALEPSSHGQLTANHIKVLRLALSAATPELLMKVQGADRLTTPCIQLLRTIHRY